MAFCCRMHEPVSFSDLNVFREWSGSTDQRFGKRELRSYHRRQWSFMGRISNTLGSFGGQEIPGGAKFCRVFHPQRKPSGAFLSPGEVSENKAILSDRIIFEIVFNRICGLWVVVSTKYRWSEGNYDAVFRLSLGLTNVHIRWWPLPAQDMTLYQQLKSHWYQISNSELERRRRI